MCYRVAERLQLSIRQLERRLGRFAFGRIANRTRDENAIVGFERTQTDFYGKFRVILAQAEELEPRAHRAYLRIMKKILAMCGMPMPISLGHEDLHRLSQQLAALVAEELLCLAVEKDDASLSIDHHHRIR